MEGWSMKVEFLCLTRKKALFAFNTLLSAISTLYNVRNATLDYLTTVTTGRIMRVGANGRYF